MNVEAVAVLHSRAPRVRCRVLKGCFVAGRRRRPGDLLDVLAAEALLLVLDQAAEIAGDTGTNPVSLRGT